jgi:NADPH:quinone reductase-like Zn-dependent oxidoreductase
MDVQPGHTLLVRGGTSSVGMAATSLAKEIGLRVIATTREPAKTTALLENGADEVLIDTGELVGEVARRAPEGVTYLLELVGAVTLLDSLRSVAPGGIVCNTGILGNEWTLDRFEPLEDIPSTVRLTTYGSSTTSAARSAPALQSIVDGISEGRYGVNVHRRFAFDEIAEAHRYMEENRGSGKLVVTVTRPPRRD